jgi:uncharacterized membrane protein
LTSSPERRRYIDQARGAAVLIMILAHAVDSWTRNADRDSVAFRNVTIVGGLAAPMFLWLSGLVLALAAARAAERDGRRRAGALALVHRGLEIFILAFLFRLQAFLVSPGGPLVAIFRVDILNVMGPAIVGAGLAWGVAGGVWGAAVICGGMATAIAMATPVVRSSPWVGHLPVGFQWYFRPAGDLTTFTLLPWAGFVFAGTAAGSILSSARNQLIERRVLVGLAVAGAALLATGLLMAARPTIYASSSFWTSSPTYFAVRLGIVMLVLALAFAGAGWTAHLRAFQVLEQFGRHSLFIYWIHVELVYGYLTWPVHRKLTLGAVLASYLVFCGVMYGALRLRRRWAPRFAALFDGTRVRKGMLAGMRG